MKTNKTNKPNLVTYLGPIASQDVPTEMTNPLTIARHLSENRILQVYCPSPLPADLQGLEAVADTLQFVDSPEATDVVLIVHHADILAVDTATEVENQMTMGRRIVLVDISQAGEDKADPDLLSLLTSSTVYVSNLAAYDIDLVRAIAVALIPLRDGLVHRRYLADTMLYYWAWQTIVKFEVKRLMGEDVIPEKKMLRATTQAKSRMGAYLLKLRNRGLRYFIRAVGYTNNHIDGFWFDLDAER